MPLHMSRSAGSTCVTLSVVTQVEEESTGPERRMVVVLVLLKPVVQAKRQAARICDLGKRRILQIAKGYREKDRWENGKGW